jgi:selenocysteine lyase/cysteine desulfurase
MSLAAWPALHAGGRTQSLPETGGAPEDEAFWARVRSEFELAPERTNLVTVVRGVTTRAVREAIGAETERLNAFRPREESIRELKNAARARAAAFVGAPSDGVALLRNTTEGVTTVLSNWPLERGDEILTSTAEHGPFYATLAYRAARDGVVVRRFHYPTPAPSAGAIVEAVEKELTARTRLVMIGQVVLTGQINPVRRIAESVHARGGKLLVDGVLGIGQVPTDVVAMDCDFYAAGLHNWGCGPRATAVFYVRPEIVERLPPLFGAYEEDDRGRFRPLWSSSTMAKYESLGAHPDAHFIALGDAIDFLSRVGVSRIQARLFHLTRRWVGRVESVPGFRAAVKVDPALCAGLVAWELEGVDEVRVRDALRERAVLVGRTEAYAGFFGIPDDRPRSLFLANAGAFTSPEDVDRLAEAIEAASAAVA